jgi:hypothetical protein
VHGARHQFLTGAGFADDRDGGSGLRGALDVAFAQAGAAPDHVMVRVKLRFEPRVLRFKPFRVEGVFHRHGGDLHDGHQLLQIRLAKIAALQVDDPAHLVADQQRRQQERRILRDQSAPFPGDARPAVQARSSPHS